MKQLASALATKGFVEITTDAEDGRARRLIATAKSRRYRRRRDEGDYAALRRCMSHLRREDVRRLASLLLALGEGLTPEAMESSGQLRGR